MNPIPDYNNLKAEELVLDVKNKINDNKEKIKELIKICPKNWEFMEKLAVLDNDLSLAVFPISHLHSVLATDEWRKAYETILPELSLYSAQMSQNQDLYQAILEIKNSPEFNNLSPTKQKIITDEIKEFEHNGVNLDDNKKKIYQKLVLELSELSNKFSNNVLDATNAFSLYLDKEDKKLLGLPNSALELFANLAKAEGREDLKITLDAPCVQAILNFAEDRDFRKDIYAAYSARASELSDEGKFNNEENIYKIRELRQFLATLLGFDDYAEYAIADNKMAKNPQQVSDFLDELVHKSKKAGLKEIEEVKNFALTNLGIEKLEPWDFSFVAEKMKKALFSLSQEELRPYFPLSKALSGMFFITKQLFGADFKENHNFPTWHNEVRVFDVYKNDELIAHFYLDPYARAKKRGGAWMDGVVNKMGEQLPIAYLVCNFSQPVNNEKDSYLTHDELTTLFHEFGHGLHHMLSEVKEYQAAGINGVEWDAVELPSQFMENFCYEKECLKMLSSHKESGEALPDDLIEKIIKAKNFLSACAMLRQLEFAIFDMRCHSEEFFEVDALEILREVRNEVAVAPNYSKNRFPMQFSHIFAGGYSAGYYSYKWAEVLSADCFAAFLEEGIFNPDTGKRFLTEFLSKGSSRSAIDNFVAFRGREPKIEALLLQSGII